MQEGGTAGMEKYDLVYLERQLHNLSRLVEINGIINSTLDMGKLLTIVMEIIKDIMETEASTLLLYEENTRDLVFKVALGEAGKELQEKYRVKVGQGIAGWVAEHRSTVYINDVYQDERFDPHFDRKTGFHTKAILCAPLLFKGRLVGVIQAINPVNRPAFTDDDVVLINAFATQCALAVQNAIYFHNALEEERIKSELKSAQTIQHSLLPDISTNYGTLRIAAKSLAAREMGGEFYEIYNFSDSVGVSMGDFQAKGIPGAIYASVASGALKALTRMKYDNPAFLIARAYDSLRDVFTISRNRALFYAHVKFDENLLRFALAGVAYTILVRDGCSRYLRFGGDFEEKEPSNVTVKLRSGDYFVVITDGIVNLKNRGGQLMGLKRIMRQLEAPHENPEDVIEALLKLMHDFTEGLERREDVSMIVMKVK
jgi:phosphoserine phosphatase RsbU/P